jgi:hypothetical protein
MAFAASLPAYQERTAMAAQPQDPAKAATTAPLKKEPSTAKSPAKK